MLDYLCLLLAAVSIGVIWRAAIRAAKPEPEPESETQDEFTLSAARWGHLHDKRRG